MPSEDHSVRDALFGLFELLATEAPPERFEEVIRTALPDRTDTESAALLDRARGLALDIHSLFARFYTSARPDSPPWWTPRGN